MNAVAAYVEESDNPTAEGTGYSHVSLEVGHLYWNDLVRPGALDALFQEVRPWYTSVRDATIAAFGGERTRISTCILLDDYFMDQSLLPSMGTPAPLYTEIVNAATRAGIELDFIARERACAEGAPSPAQIVVDSLCPDPPPDTRGIRPSVFDSGWLANGQRSLPFDVEGGASVEWHAPRQNRQKNHSIFLDIELWSGDDGERTWSCPFLAAVWQTMRLGLLRQNGALVMRPEPLTDNATWANVPPLVQVSERERVSFAAYKTFSILHGRFAPVEHAVRSILNQTVFDFELLAEGPNRAAREGVSVDPAVVDRLGYIFLPGGVS